MQTNSGRIHDYCENDQRRQSTPVVLGRIRGACGDMSEWRRGVVCHRGWELKRWIKTRDGGGSLLFQSRSSEKWFDGRAAVSSRATESLIKSLSLNPSRTHCLGLYPLVLRRRRFLLSNLFLQARSPRRSKTQQISRLWSPRSPASTSSTRRPPLFVIYVCVRAFVYMYKYFSPALSRSTIVRKRPQSEKAPT